MKFQIEYDRQPLLFLQHLDKHISKRVLEKIDGTLSVNPVPQNAKAIVGQHGVFRFRIGDYRALYRINYEAHKIIVFKLDKRSRVY